MPRGRPKQLYHMKRLHVHLPESQVDLLKRISAASHMSVAEHVRRAVEGYNLSQGPRYGVSSSPVPADAPGPMAATATHRAVLAGENPSDWPLAQGQTETTPLEKLTAEVWPVSPDEVPRPSVELPVPEVPLVVEKDNEVWGTALEHPRRVIIQEFKP